LHVIMHHLQSLRNVQCVKETVKQSVTMGPDSLPKELPKLAFGCD